MNVFARGILALLIASTPLAAQAATPQPTHSFRLDNGLKVIVREDHRAPVVVSQLWYKVGSSYEPAGLSGLSHALEHMMFKGSSKLGPGEASRILRELGAEENAFTSADYTAYYQVLARDRLEVALEMEADRLARPALPADEFSREIEVIKEERRLRTDDNPSALAFERFKTAAFPASGYRTPTIGWMHDLERLQVDDLRRWHQDWYNPGNATLVVAGAVSLEEVRPLVERHFAAIPARPLPASRPPLELANLGERRLSLAVRTQVPSLLMGFNAPGLASSDNPREVHALRLIAALLDGGYSARLASELERKQQKVSSASAWYDPFTRGDSLFVLSARPNLQGGHDLATVEAALWAELERLKHEPPSAEELARVQAQVIAQLVYARDSITEQATGIGRLESVGLPWTLLDEELDALRAVSAEDIQSAARRLFQRERLTLAQILPEEQS